MYTRGGHGNSTQGDGGCQLRRLAAMCLTGRLAEAELQLHDLYLGEHCPSEAQWLLAGLAARRSDNKGAISIIERKTRSATLPDIAFLHVCLLLATNQPDAARRLATHLHRRWGHMPAVRNWLATVQPVDPASLPAFSQASVDRLADELVARPEVIPTLVAAQKTQNRDSLDRRTIELLCWALTRASMRLTAADHQAVVCRAMAELSLLAGQPDTARRWAHRGLKLEPYSAPLALVLAQIDDDVRVGPPARQALQAVAQAHPDYPDVQAAAIRRHHTDGFHEQARLLLEQWSHRQPDNPTLRQVSHELAA